MRPVFLLIALGVFAPAFLGPIVVVCGIFAPILFIKSGSSKSSTSSQIIPQSDDPIIKRPGLAPTTASAILKGRAFQELLNQPAFASSSYQERPNIIEHRAFKELIS